MSSIRESGTKSKMIKSNLRNKSINLKDEIVSGWGDNTRGNFVIGEPQKNSDANLLKLSIDWEKLL